MLMQSYCELLTGIAHHLISHPKHNRIGCAMFSGLAWNAVYRGFEP